MAAGSFTLFNIAKQKLANGTFLLPGAANAYRMALASNVQSLDWTFAGASTDARYADLTAEVTANATTNYTAGGQNLAMTISRTVNVVTVNCDNHSWTTMTANVKYAVIYKNDNTNKDLLGYIDLETTSVGGLFPSNGTLAITINASGLFTLT